MEKTECTGKSRSSESAVEEISQALFSPGKHIDSLEELKEVLDKAGIKHSQGYFHYTTMEKCRNMFTGGKLFLSHAAYMNDKLEAADIDPRMYIACFGYGVEENIGMWGNYGRPQSDAVRLRFPMSGMKGIFTNIRVKVNDGKCAKDVVAYAVRNDEFEDITADRIAGVSLHDVGYVGKSGKTIEHCRTYYLLKQALGKKAKHKLSSYIKKRGWAYEHEVRLVIRMKTELLDEQGNPIRNVAVDFRDVLKRMKDRPGCVTIGPWFDRNPYKLFEELDIKLPPSCISLSEYAGMVDLKDMGVYTSHSEGHVLDGSTICFQNCTFNFK